MGEAIHRVTDLAEAIGVSRPALYKWRKEHANFPGGFSGPWDLEEVRRWRRLNLTGESNHEERAPAERPAGGDGETARAPEIPAETVELARRALARQAAGEEPNAEERKALRRYRQARQERERERLFGEVTKADLARLAGRQPRTLTDLAARYGLPISTTTNLFQLIRRLFDIMVSRSEGGDDDISIDPDLFARAVLGEIDADFVKALIVACGGNPNKTGQALDKIESFRGRIVQRQLVEEKKIDRTVHVRSLVSLVETFRGEMDRLIAAVPARCDGAGEAEIRAALKDRYAGMMRSLHRRAQLDLATLEQIVDAMQRVREITAEMEPAPADDADDVEPAPERALKKPARKKKRRRGPSKKKAAAKPKRSKRSGKR